MACHPLQRLKIDRIHVAPRALELSPVGTQQRYRDVWHLLNDVAARLRALPVGLVRFWLNLTSGHVVLTHMLPRYERGEWSLGRSVLRNVACIRVSDLTQGSLDAWVPLGHLLDHLMGTGGSPDGPWLSDGGGINQALQAVGDRVAGLFPLGYGFDEAARQDVRGYFARSLALYLQDRRALNVADPHMEKLLRATVLSEAFWRSHQIQAPANPTGTSRSA